MWIDAHCHLQDTRLGGFGAENVEGLRAAGVVRAVVNGTSPADWPGVVQLARAFPDFIVPAFGLHPWHVGRTDSSWRDELQRLLDEFPHAGVGEIGLDQWMRNPDTKAQEDAFVWQWTRAIERGRTISVHCLKAWSELDALWPALAPHPGRVLFHGFTGDYGLASRWHARGCLLGFGGHALQPRKITARDAFRRLPVEAILLETDAPDMPGPEERRTHFLPDPALNHPANLRAYGQALAALRECPPESLAAALCSNTERWLGSTGSAGLV